MRSAFVSRFQATRSVRKKHQGLPIQSRQPRDSPETFSTREIEAHNLVAGDAIEDSIWSKAQASRFMELSLPFWREDSNEVAIVRIVFPNARHRIYRAEWMLARDNDVAVRCNSQVERTQFGIRHQTRELRGRASTEGHYGIIALAVGADSRSKEKVAIMAESKPSRKRYDFGW